MPERWFRRLVAEYGCHLEPTGSGEWKVVKGAQTVCFIAITHRYRREVKQVYVKKFLKRIVELEGNPE